MKSYAIAALIAFAFAAVIISKGIAILHAATIVH